MKGTITVRVIKWVNNMTGPAGSLHSGMLHSSRRNGKAKGKTKRKRNALFYIGELHKESHATGPETTYCIKNRSATQIYLLVNLFIRHYSELTTTYYELKLILFRITNESYLTFIPRIYL